MRVLLPCAVATTIAACALPSLSPSSAGAGGQALSTSSASSAAPASASSASGAGGASERPVALWAIEVDANLATVPTSVLAVDDDVLVAFDVPASTEFRSGSCDAMIGALGASVVARFDGASGACRWASAFEGAHQGRLVHWLDHVALFALVALHLPHTCANGPIDVPQPNAIVRIDPTNGDCDPIRSHVLDPTVPPASASASSASFVVGGAGAQSTGELEIVGASGTQTSVRSFGPQAVTSLQVAGAAASDAVFAAVTFGGKLDLFGTTVNATSSSDVALARLTGDLSGKPKWLVDPGPGSTEAIAFSATSQAVVAGGAKSGVPALWMSDAMGTKVTPLTIAGVTGGGVHALDATDSALFLAGGGFTGKLGNASHAPVASGEDGFVWIVDANGATRGLVAIGDSSGASQRVTAVGWGTTGNPFVAGTSASPARFPGGATVPKAGAFVAKLDVP